jgi:hypothetical protein
MKVKAKTAFFNGKKLYKKGDVLEIETAAFNPINMIEIPEIKAEKKAAEVKTAKKSTTKKKG